jgi:hypothetical protein
VGCRQVFESQSEEIDWQAGRVGSGVPYDVRVANCLGESRSPASSLDPEPVTARTEGQDVSLSVRQVSKDPYGSAFDTVDVVRGLPFAVNSVVGRVKLGLPRRRTLDRFLVIPPNDWTVYKGCYIHRETPWRRRLPVEVHRANVMAKTRARNLADLIRLVTGLKTEAYQGDNGWPTSRRAVSLASSYP